MRKTKEEMITINMGGVTLGVRTADLQAALARGRGHLGRMLKRWGVAAVLIVAALHPPDAKPACRCSRMAAQNAAGQQVAQHAAYCQ